VTDKPDFAFNLRLDGGKVTIETPGDVAVGTYQDIRLELPDGEFVTIKVRQPEPHGYGHAWRFEIHGLEVIGADISPVPDFPVPARGGAITLLKPDEDGPRNFRPVKLPT
jgi:hypothetical protein